MTTNNVLDLSLLTETGTGNYAGSTSASFITPILGTPASGILSGCTGLPLSTGITGTLPIANLTAFGSSGVSKILSNTYNLATASGTQTWTGAGFTPSLVIFINCVSSVYTFSIGFDNGASPNCLYNNPNGDWGTNSTSILVFPSAGNFQTAVISSFNSDGFVLTWTKTNSPTGTATIYALVFK
jgi:hypothetical protein